MRVVKAASFLNERYDTFNAILQKFLYATEPVIETLPTVAVLAVAGPVSNNKVLFTSNGWLIDGKDIEADFGGAKGIKRAVLINDFVGCGYGVLTLDHKTEAVCLNEAKMVEGAPIVCVGAGTGLGECYLTSHKGDKGTYECFASEGGHAEFAPRTDVEFELLKFLKKKFSAKHRVSTERVVSGTGLANLYEFFSHKNPSKANKKVAKEFEKAGSMKVRQGR